MPPYAHCIELTPARKAREIRPLVDWHKGSALEFLLRRLGTPEPLLICAGDDASDEDMFRAFPDAVCIQVGARAATAARYYVSSPAQLAAVDG